MKAECSYLADILPVLKPGAPVPAGQLVIGVQQIKMALLRMCIRPGTLRFIDIVGDPDLHRFFQQLRRFTIARIASDQLPDVIFVRMTAFPVGQDLSAGGGNEDRGKASYCRLLPGQ